MSSNQLERDGQGMGIYGTIERCRRVLVGRQRKRPLGRPEYRWGIILK